MSQVLIDMGALKMALNVLRRAGKVEVADELEKAVCELPAPATPSSKWYAQGETDLHGDRYNCERASLTMGDWTDDELANAVFLHGNETPDIRDVIAGKAKMPIVYLTAAKDRIRWLSRALERAIKDAERLDWFQENIVFHKPAGYDGRNVGRFDIVWDSETDDLRDAIDAAMAKGQSDES